MQSQEFNELKSILQSISWGQVYNSTIVDSEWLLDKSVSPGRWAVGYEFLYVLYRALNDMRPNSILELGLGQSTKIIGQYAKHMGIPHYVVEHDEAWVNHFFSSWDKLSKNTIVNVLPLIEREKSGDKYFEYDGFERLVHAHRYELISVDGPFGGDGKASRRDIINVLPEILADDFAILFDDCGRIGERNTVEETVTILKKAGIPFNVGFYDGGSYKQTYIIVSRNWKWLTTL